MVNNQQSSHRGSCDNEAREDFANSLVGLIYVANMVANNESSMGPMACVFVSAMVESPNSIPTFGEYLSSGTGVKFKRRGISEDTRKELDEASSALIAQIEQLNRDPLNRPAFAEAIRLVSTIVPNNPKTYASLRTAQEKILSSESVTWKDLMRQVSKPPQQELKLPPRDA